MAEVHKKESGRKRRPLESMDLLLSNVAVALRSRGEDGHHLQAMKMEVLKASVTVVPTGSRSGLFGRSQSHPLSSGFLVVHGLACGGLG